MHGVTSDQNSFVTVPTKNRRHPVALVSISELLEWLDSVVGPVRTHLDCCFGTMHQGAEDTAAMTAFTAYNGSVVTGYSYAADAVNSPCLIAHAIECAAQNIKYPHVSC